MTKAELRKEFKKKRLDLTEENFQSKNEEICRLFFETIELHSIKVLHIFLPIKKKREPDTWRIINRLQTEYPRIDIVIPKVNQNIEKIESFSLKGSNLKENEWGIPEPMDGTIIDPQKIDMILVPLLAIDKTGHRIGYGKGHYDQFFTTCRKDCKRVGLSLFEPIDVISDLYEHDFKLTDCITPNGLHHFI